MPQNIWLFATSLKAFGTCTCTPPEVYSAIAVITAPDASVAMNELIRIPTTSSAFAAPHTRATTRVSAMAGHMFQ
ncbi:unannotated protein [freshwater metagenome]|uniref:Unannotated protein n=1 Tax=freshwater metagenome TaxID=449393 RepID=A0A6J7EIH1_9ZZZZ